MTALFYLVSILPVGYTAASVFSSLYFISIDVLLWFLLLFAIRFTRFKSRHVTVVLPAVFAPLCAADSIVMLINPFSEIAISYTYRDTVIAPYAYVMHPLYYCHLVLCYLMVLSVIAIMVVKTVRTPSSYKMPYLMGLLGVIFVVAYNAVFLFLPEKTLFNFIDYAIFGYSLAAFFVYWSAFSYPRHGMMKSFRKWVFDNIGQGIVLFDYENHHLTHNRRLQEMLPVLELTDECSMEDFMAQCCMSIPADSLNENATFQFYLPRDSDPLPIRCDLRVMRGRSGDILGHLFVMTDQADEHDPLTFFHNWSSFKRALHDSARIFAIDTNFVAACDIDSLQFINESHGRHVGDQAIHLLAETMREEFPGGTYFVRGHEATLLALCTNTDAASIEACLRRVTDRLNNNNSFNCFISAQYALSPVTEDGLESTINEVFRGLRTKKILDRRSVHSELLASLIRALQQCDNDTEAHVRRTQQSGIALGERLNLSDIQLSNLSLLCILHDIGKIGVPLEILNKPGKLTDNEWAVLKTHVEKGYQICQSSQELQCIADMVLHHHERWDGKGYPDGLSKESIPLLSRIIAIVDSFDAMTNNRSYRRAMTLQEAFNELRRCAGTQFDPGIVSEFIALIEAQPELVTPYDAPPADELLPDPAGQFALPPVSEQDRELNHVHVVQHGQYVIDTELRIVSANKGFELLTGYTQDDIAAGIRQLDLLPEEDRPAYLLAVTEQLANGPVAYIEHRIIRKDGRAQYVFCYGRNFFDSAVRSNRTEIVIIDSANSNAVRSLVAEERARAQLRLSTWEKKYRTDPLTGLLSHEAFRNDVDMHLLNDEMQCMLLMMDVDHFKQYNDRLGHRAGDEFLIRTAQALSAPLRKDDLACRMGGDEFAVALFFKSGTELTNLRRRANEICEQLNEIMQANRTGTSLSMGASVSDKNIRSFNELYEEADKALYQSKNEGRSRMTTAF